MSQTCAALSFNVSKLSLNLYMSVPTQTVLPEHKDPYDVLICMHRGQKQFRVCTPSSWTNQSFTESELWCREVLLQPGRCLFLRKGVVHQARTLGAEYGEQHVIHTTMGFVAKTRRQLFTCSSSGTSCPADYHSSTGKYTGSSCGCDHSKDCDCWFRSRCCDRDQSCECDSCTGCIQCESNCGTGRYRRGCGSRSRGSCSPCTNAQLGFYYTGTGGLRDKCPVKACPSCPVGQFRKSCSGTTSSGTCVPCTGLKKNHYFSANGGHTDSCPQQKCADCGAGRYRSGCYEDGTKPTSSGSCVDCPAGTANDVRFALDSSACSPCTPGYYAPNKGTALCHACKDCPLHSVGTSLHRDVRKGCGSSQLGACIRVNILEPACDPEKCSMWYEGETAHVKLTSNEPICEVNNCGDLTLELYRRTAENSLVHVTTLATVSEGPSLATASSWLVQVSVNRTLIAGNSVPQVFLLRTVYHAKPDSPHLAQGVSTSDEFLVRSRGAFFAKEFRSGLKLTGDQQKSYMEAICNKSKSETVPAVLDYITYACSCVDNLANGFDCLGMMSTMSPVIKKGADDAVTAACDAQLDTLETSVARADNDVVLATLKLAKKQILQQGADVAQYIVQQIKKTDLSKWLRQIEATLSDLDTQDKLAMRESRRIAHDMQQLMRDATFLAQEAQDTFTDMQLDMRGYIHNTNIHVKRNMAEANGAQSACIEAANRGNILGKIFSVVKAVVGAMTGNFAMVLSSIGSLLDVGVLKTLGTLAGSFQSFTSNFDISDLGNSIASVAKDLGKLPSLVKNAVKDLGVKIKDTWKQQIEPALKNGWQLLKHQANQEWEKIKNFPQQQMDKLKDGFRLGLGESTRSLKVNFDFDTSAAPGVNLDLKRRLQHATDVFFSQLPLKVDVGVETLIGNTDLEKVINGAFAEVIDNAVLGPGADIGFRKIKNQLKSLALDVPAIQDLSDLKSTFETWIDDSKKLLSETGVVANAALVGVIENAEKAARQAMDGFIEPLTNMNIPLLDTMTEVLNGHERIKIDLLDRETLAQVANKALTSFVQDKIPTDLIADWNAMMNGASVSTLDFSQILDTTGVGESVRKITDHLHRLASRNGVASPKMENLLHTIQQKVLDALDQSTDPNTGQKFKELRQMMDLLPGQLDIFIGEVLDLSSLSRHLEEAITVPIDRDGRSIQDLYVLTAKSIPECKVDPGHGGLSELQNEVNRCIKQWIEELPSKFSLDYQKDDLTCPKPACTRSVTQDCCGLSFQHGYDEDGCPLYPCGRCDECSSPRNDTILVKDDNTLVLPTELQQQNWWSRACSQENMTTLPPIGPAVSQQCLLHPCLFVHFACCIGSRTLLAEFNT